MASWLPPGDTRATWQVDDKTPYVSNGGVSDYFGWLAFDELSSQILTDLALGKHSLEITTTDGKKLEVGLHGISLGMLSFNGCIKPQGTTAAVTKQNSGAPASSASQQKKSCLLEIKGKNIINSACTWTAIGDSGFQIEAGGYFAQLLQDNASHGTGYWNGSKGGTHAHDELGDLTKQGDCWVNSQARICIK